MHPPDLMLNILGPHLLLLAYGLTCLLAGRAILGGLGLLKPGSDLQSNAWLGCFFSLAAGLALSLLCLFLLGTVGALAPGPVALAHALILLVAARATGFRLRPLSIRSLLRPEAFVLAALYVWLALLAIRAPGHFDDTMYHLPLARHYLQHHALVPQPFLRFPLFPQSMELLFALGLMLGHEVIAQTLAALPLGVMALGLLGLSRRFHASLLPGVLAAGLLPSLGPVRQTLGYAYVDNGLGLFSFGALLALALWEDGGRQQRGWVIVSGLLAGAAMSCKLFGLIPAALIGAWLLLVRRRLADVLLYGAAAFLLGSGWRQKGSVRT